MPRLVLVSNRLPVSVRLERGKLVIERSNGGLASGLRGVHASGDTTWVGWPGDVSRLVEAQRRQLADTFAALRVSPVPLSAAEVTAYYDGFSNGVLWPLFHYLLDRVPLEAATWEAYVRVNMRFADVVAEHVGPADTVWVHDYHLCLVPAMLRARIPGLRIGFFLHIPFPSAEVFRTLARRRPVLEGILGADVVGFHTAGYRRHFAHAVALVLGHRVERGAPGEGHVLRVDRRAVRLVTAPMGVDAAALGQLAESPDVQAASEALRQPGTRLLLGIDRLDYTKGIPRRMLAFERLLEREPSLRGTLRFLQLAVPSREKVDAYRQIRRQVEEHVGRINGLYTQGSTVPIHYVYRALDEAQVVAHYRAADVMLVTPLRDGMNLVAKEFVAARNDNDGVLVLSELAGAADELTSALVVNPYDIGLVASALARALEMPAPERRLRMTHLRGHVLRDDVHQWAERFLVELRTSSPTSPLPSDGPQLTAALAAVRAAPRRHLLLDYDGTLIPFAPRPELAVPDAALLDLLARLTREPGAEVHLVSGRRRADLARWFGALDVGLHAEHGLWSRWPGAGHWEMRPVPPPEWIDAVRETLATWVARLPGAAVEEKTASLAFHYRETGLSAAPPELQLALEEYCRWLPVELIAGSRVLELRSTGANKGAVVEALARRGLDGAILALGDDHTDADLFAALPASAVTVQVGNVPLPARFRVDGPAAARALLETLLTRAEV